MSTAVYFYIAGVWSLLAGILFHALTPHLRRLGLGATGGYGHYLMQTTGTVLITIGVASSRNGMWPELSGHVIVGYTALALLWLNVVGGSALYAIRKGGRKQLYSSVFWYHRWVALVIIILVSYQYATGANGPIAVYNIDKPSLRFSGVMWIGLITAIYGAGLLQRLS